MSKNIIVSVLLLGLFLAGGAVLAARGTLSIPQATDNDPAFVFLGKKIDPGSGKLVEGYAIIHYKEKAARPAGKPGGGSSCYGFLAKGAKWKTVESWMFNTSNIRDLDGVSVFNLLSNGIAKWENAAGSDILGDGVSTPDTLAADTVSPDNKNEVYFANVGTQNAIAVTIIWGIFGGPIFQRELVEWDQIYDDIDYDWSLAGETGKMDFDNIATHELGHSVGMADIYESGCGEVTMYGYAIYGETKKQTLEPADIAGVSALY
jgi:hypothetical protein